MYMATGLRYPITGNGRRRVQSRIFALHVERIDIVANAKKAVLLEAHPPIAPPPCLAAAKWITIILGRPLSGIFFFFSWPEKASY
ncbi:hypothetical protein TgHK011_002949 [Trichoderma gracile]|nr:hypothetical protein TgHK011_002949 [Trichoderma gracile]